MSVIFIEKEDIASAWIEALTKVMEHGDSISTSYDKEGDIPSKDATVMIKINKPFSNPMRNRRSKDNKILEIQSKLGNSYKIYGHMGDYCLIPSIQSGYIEEIMEGINDHLIQESETSYPYSYHNRIFNYKSYSEEDIKHIDYDISRKNFNDSILLSNYRLPSINQIELVIEGLKKSPISRRIQATTWRPYSDPFRSDPPCLQRLHFRVKNEKLNMNSYWRSRDLFKAWQSNVNGMIRIQKLVADKCGFEIGCYTDISDSLHIYGRDIKDVEGLL